MKPAIDLQRNCGPIGCLKYSLRVQRNSRLFKAKSATDWRLLQSWRLPLEPASGRCLFGYRMPFAGTTVGLMAVSLTHLSDGVSQLTAIPPWQAWAMAVGIDCMLISVALWPAGHRECLIDGDVNGRAYSWRGYDAG